MFFSRLRSQYYIWCLFAFGIGFPNILSNLISLDILSLIVNAFMVATLAFALYCVWYPISLLLKRFKGRKLPTMLLLLAFTTLLFAQPQPADANLKELIKRHAKPVGTFILGVIIADKADDAWDAFEEKIEEPIYKLNYWVQDKVGDAWDYLTTEEEYKYSISCSQCDYVFKTNDYDQYMRKSGTGVCHDDYQPYNSN